MTIIKNARKIKSYPFRRVDDRLVEALENEWETTLNRDEQPSKKYMLLYLECYCDLIQRSLFLEEFLSPDFGQVINDFLRAYKGEDLTGILYSTAKPRWFKIFCDALEQLSVSKFSSTPEWLLSISWDDLHPLELDPSDYSYETQSYWSAWAISSRKGHNAFLELLPLYSSHGSKFTMEFYERVKGFIAKQAKSKVNMFKDFALFLSENGEEWTVSTFEDPIALKQCINAYLIRYFLYINKSKRDLDAAIAEWNQFSTNLTEVFLEPGVWAQPFGEAVPKFKRLKVKGTRSRVSENKDGIVVHNKLLTEVPLQYTDDETIEILFCRIEKDLGTVRLWARNQAYRLRLRQKKRVALSKQGKALKITESDSFPQRVADVNFSDICATFERFGFSTDYSPDIESLFRYMQKIELAYKIGLPTSHSLFPFMALLIIDHPEITRTFLSEFDLYNEKGQLSGFIKTDAGYQLTGYKDRRKASLSEQKIILKPRAASLVRQVIEITTPLRDFLKSNGDSNWRKLFLTSGQAFAYPKVGITDAFRKADKPLLKETKLSQKMEQEFKKYTDLRGADFRRFAIKITLSSIRASTGVLVYLQTQSVDKMAKALGHATYDSKLLDQYLPDSIQAFFQTRWIRIFQRAFICHAMKDSPFLIRATDFGSMHELHEFLKNHALKDIPEHLSDPEKVACNKKINPSSDQILISIDSGILSTLLSLKCAVDNSKKSTRISGLARYWGKVSGLIESEINNGSDALLKQHLKVAKENLDPDKMEGLIYDNAA